MREKEAEKRFAEEKARKQEERERKKHECEEKKLLKEKEKKEKAKERERKRLLKEQEKTQKRMSRNVKKPEVEPEVDDISCDSDEEVEELDDDDKVECPICHVGGLSCHGFAATIVTFGTISTALMWIQIIFQIFFVVCR